MPRRRVYCWNCGREARRRVVVATMAVVGCTERVSSYGRCTTMDPWPCDGVLLRSRERDFVLRAAILYDARGGNARSEFDG